MVGATSQAVVTTLPWQHKGVSKGQWDSVFCNSLGVEQGHLISENIMKIFNGKRNFWENMFSTVGFIVPADGPAQVVEILPHGRQGPIYPTFSITWLLMTSQQKKPGHPHSWHWPTLVARFMGPTWGPSGADRTQAGPMLASWTLLSG